VVTMASNLLCGQPWNLNWLPSRDRSLTHNVLCDFGVQPASCLVRTEDGLFSKCKVARP
jgi:hypothetical protein